MAVNNAYAVKDLFESGREHGWVVKDWNDRLTDYKWRHRNDGWFHTQDETAWVCKICTDSDDNWNRIAQAHMSCLSREKTLKVIIDKEQPNEKKRSELQDFVNWANDVQWNKQVKEWTQNHGDLPTSNQLPIALCMLTQIDPVEPEDWLLSVDEKDPRRIKVYNCYEGIGSGPQVMQIEQYWLLERAPAHSEGDVIE